MAVYMYRFEIRRLANLANDPANFSKFLYQPEVDHETG